MDYTPLQIERELSRIGVDPIRLRGLASSGRLSAAEILRWLRSLPSGLGHEEVMRRLALPAEEGGPGGSLGPILSADPGYVHPEIDERLALMREIDRVVPESHQPGTTFGLNFPHGRAAALAALRRLPDRAGAAAAVAALAVPPTSEPGR